jgi:thiol-disulfide isomerase/thioredoxin
LEIIMTASAKIAIAACLLSFVVLSSALTFAADRFPPAPHLVFTGLSGEKVSVDQFKGSVVLLNFWTTSCGICLSEIPTLSALQDQYGSQGLRVIGVALDSNSTAIHKVMSERRITYTVAAGDEKMEEQLGAGGFPVTFLIGRDGRLYGQHSGAIRREALEGEVTQLLSASAESPVDNFRASDEAQPVRLPSPVELNSEIPGIDVSHLSKAQLAQLKQQLESESCPCGCNRSVLQCRTAHSSCNRSQEMARDALQKLHGGMI